MPKRSSTRCMMDSLEPRMMLSSNRVVGYFPEYRWSTFNNIDWAALSHVNYFSVGANTSGGLTTGNINLSHMATLISTAHSNNVKVSITVGPQSFATIAASPSATTTFVNNIVQFATSHNFDGIDLDWEPTPTGSNINLYGTLIDALHAQAAPHGLILTAAVNPLNKEIPLAATAKLDWLNVMCYDFSPNNHSTYTASVNAMNGWANYGVPKDKLVMGVPFYGRQGSTWSTTTARTYGAIMNDYFAANNVYPSPDADFIDGWYFNGQTTIANKSNFVVNNGFGGIMIWEIGQDHFIGGQYTSMSLLPVIKNIIQPGDVTPPVIEHAEFGFETAPQTLSFQFSENVGASLQRSHLSVNDTATQASILVTAMTYDPATNTATFTLNNAVPDGVFRATLDGAAITDASGNPLGEDYTFDFFFLRGDATRDGMVNLADFNIMAQNFGLSGKTFSQGDFSLDGTVNLEDFNLLAARFGTSIEFPPAAAATTGSSGKIAPARSPAPGRGDSTGPFSTTRIARGDTDRQRMDDELATL